MAVARRLVGRVRELQRLGRIFNSEEAEFLAIYGRPGVGKTYLIREYFRGQTYFEVTGEFQQNLDAHLKSFCDEVARVFYDGRPIPAANSWNGAFELLCAGVQEYALRRPGVPIIIFLDELSWLAGPRSPLPAALARAWNLVLGRLDAVCLIVCSSAVAWMQERFVFAKDTLPKCVTHKLELRPFSLAESSAFLKAHSVDLSDLETAHLYMSIGGVPQYLRQVRPGRSVTEIVGELFFGSDGLISTDLETVVTGLFEAADLHLKVLRVLANRRQGQSQDELATSLSMASGVRLKRCLAELESSGLLASFSPYSGKKKDAVFRIADEYTYFYFRWIDRVPEAVKAEGVEYWQAKAGSKAYERWAAYAFESLCLKHMTRLAQALGGSEQGIDARVWRHSSARWAQPAAASGAQISLSLQSEAQDEEPELDGAAQVAVLLDGDDDTTTICEMRYSDGPVSLGAKDARYLAEKLRLFGRASRSNKTLKLAIVSPEGLEDTMYSGSLVAESITLAVLFDPPAPKPEVVPAAVVEVVPLAPMYGPELAPLPDVVPDPIVLQDLEPLPEPYESELAQDDMEPAIDFEPDLEPAEGEEAGAPEFGPEPDWAPEFEPDFAEPEVDLAERRVESETSEPELETGFVEPESDSLVPEDASDGEVIVTKEVLGAPGDDLAMDSEREILPESESESESTLADEAEDRGCDEPADDLGGQDDGSSSAGSVEDAEQSATADVGDGGADSEPGGSDDPGGGD